LEQKRRQSIRKSKSLNQSSDSSAFEFNKSEIQSALEEVKKVAAIPTPAPQPIIINITYQAKAESEEEEKERFLVDHLLSKGLAKKLREKSEQ
jgi:hypothetical protein